MLLMDMMDLTGQTAIVTGGSGWLGTQVSQALLEMGATVYAVSRGKSHDFSEGLGDNQLFRRVWSDMTDPAAIEMLVSLVVDETGRIDILVNNSYAWPKVTDFLAATWDGMRATLDAGLTAPMMLTQLILKRMMAARHGNIINIASMYGHVSPDQRIYRGIGGNALEYGASKAALVQATRYIAAIGGREGVRCNSISPGPFPRPGAFDGKEWFREELSGKTMLGRVGKAEELKGAIAFLASDLSSYVTGTDIRVDGGWTAW